LSDSFFLFLSIANRFLERLIIFSKKLAKTVEAAFRESTALGDPVSEWREPPRLDPAGAHASDLLAPDETALFQHLKMLDDRSKRRVERFGQGTDGGWSMTQPLYDGPAR